MCRKQRNISKMSEKKAVIKNVDMSEEIQQEAIGCATQRWRSVTLKKISQLISRKHFYVHGVSLEILQDKDLKLHVETRHQEFEAFLCKRCEFGNIAR